MMSEREELAALLPELADADVSTLLRVARGLRVTMAPAAGDGVDLAAIMDAAPPDDEPWTPEDEAAAREAEADIAAGRVYSADDVRRMLSA
jgi:hypothetical protein